MTGKGRQAVVTLSLSLSFQTLSLLINIDPPPLLPGLWCIQSYRQLEFVPAVYTDTQYKNFIPPYNTVYR